MKKIENYIHGKLVFNSTKEQSVYDPSTGEEISKVVLSDSNDFMMFDLVFIMNYVFRMV